MIWRSMYESSHERQLLISVHLLLQLLRCLESSCHFCNMVFYTQLPFSRRVPSTRLGAFLGMWTHLPITLYCSKRDAGPHSQKSVEETTPKRVHMESTSGPHVVKNSIAMSCFSSRNLVLEASPKRVHMESTLSPHGSTLCKCPY